MYEKEDSRTRRRGELCSFVTLKTKKNDNNCLLRPVICTIVDPEQLRKSNFLERTSTFPSSNNQPP